jgi:hypothetical protein
MSTVLKVEAPAPEAEYLQVVYAEVYAPNRLDAQYEYMTVDEIRKMAWLFMMGGDTKRIDVMHDNKLIEAYVVESFIARDDDGIYIPGSWVVGVYIEDTEVWAAVLSGELNGFSMEALVGKDFQELEITMPTSVSGKTSEAKGHSHSWNVNYSPDGALMGGSTDKVDGHFHIIKSGTVTEEAAGHTHRFSSVDNLAVVPVSGLS